MGDLVGNVRVTEGEPHDRLTAYAADMSDVLEAKGAAAEDVKAIIMLQDDEHGGLVLHGYDEMTEAITDLLAHVAAVCQANGMKLQVIPGGFGHG